MRGRLLLPNPHTSNVLLNACLNVKRATAADCPQRGQKLPAYTVWQFRHSWFSAERGAIPTPLRCHATKREKMAQARLHALEAAKAALLNIIRKSKFSPNPKRSVIFFECSFKTKRSKKDLHTTQTIKPEIRAKKLYSGLCQKLFNRQYNSIQTMFKQHCYKCFHPAFYITLYLYIWQHNSCVR